MIGPELEQAQSGGPGFFDFVSIEVCDPGAGLFCLLRVVRLPPATGAGAIALLRPGEVMASRRVSSERDPGGWEAAEVDGLRLTTEKPLERWTAACAADSIDCELELEAISAPIGLEETEGGPASVSVNQYEQICELRGTVSVGGGPRTIGGIGRRRHAWGVHDWSRLAAFRSLYAASEEDGAVTVSAGRPAGSAGHGDERRRAFLISSGEPVAFEDVRISTVYGSDRLPKKAGLELYMSGDEYPRRVSGESVSATEIDVGAERLTVSFFRWTLDGRPAFGSYETLVPR